MGIIYLLIGLTVKANIMSVFLTLRDLARDLSLSEMLSKVKVFTHPCVMPFLIFLILLLPPPRTLKNGVCLALLTVAVMFFGMVLSYYLIIFQHYALKLYYKPPKMIRVLRLVFSLVS